VASLVGGGLAFYFLQDPMGLIVLDVIESQVFIIPDEDIRQRLRIKVSYRDNLQGILISRRILHFDYHFFHQPINDLKVVLILGIVDGTNQHVEVILEEAHDITALKVELLFVLNERVRLIVPSKEDSL